MIVKVSYKKLSKEILNALSAGVMELQDVKALRKNVEEYVTPKKKAFIYIIVLMIVTFGVMGGSSIMNMSKNGPVDYSLLLFILVPVIVVLALGLALGAWINFGMIKSQYNSALKKGYPQMYEELKL